MVYAAMPVLLRAERMVDGMSASYAEMPTLLRLILAALMITF